MKYRNFLLGIWIILFLLVLTFSGNSPLHKFTGFSIEGENESLEIENQSLILEENESLVLEENLTESGNETEFLNETENLEGTNETEEIILEENLTQEENLSEIINESEIVEEENESAEISTPMFQTQFDNKIVMENGSVVLSVIKNGQVQHPNYQVDGITGGTITSNGVDKMIKNSISQYSTFLKN